MSAHLGFSEVVPYCASKGAVLAMTRALAVEWAQDNITVNKGLLFPNVSHKCLMAKDGKKEGKI